MNINKAYLVLSSAGAALIVTQNDISSEPALLAHSVGNGLNKYIAFEIPMEQVKHNYSAHLEHIFNDPKETGQFMTLDDDERQVFKNISLKALGSSIIYEE
jgi:hypothetical protein